MKDSSVALFKIEKLLEKIEKDIKKHQDKEIYRESDKYMRHAQKTIDLYSLTLDEVLCTPGQVNLQRHCTVLKRMFKGMQGQVKSVLKFALYHFKQRSEKLEEQYDDGTGSPSNVADAQRGSANTFDNRGSTGGSPTSLATFSRNGKPNFTMMLPNVQMSPQNLSSSPQSLYTMRNSARSPISNYSRGGDFVLQNGTYNGYAEEKGQWGSLNQFGDNDEEDFELLKFQQEHKRIQEEIDEFLKGKEIIEQIAPTKVSSNLKQVLRGLEHTTKKVNQIADAPPVVDDDDDDFDEPKFAEMGKKIKKAFNQAKVKAVMTLGGILKANGSQSPRGQEEALAQVLAAVEKEIAEQEPDAVDEGEGVAELNELKQKIEAIEKDRADNLEKVKILTSENSELAQDKRELREKVLSLENDILAIKEMYQISRLEWADTKTAMKRKFEEAQQEWQKKAATPVVIYQPSVVTAPQKVEQTETFTVEQNEENYAPSQTEEKEEDEEQAAENENEDNVNEEAQSVKEQGSSQGFSNFVTETTAGEEVSASVLAAAQKVHVNKDHINSETATKKVTASNEHNSSDIKSEASTKSQPGEQAKNKSRESGKRVSDNETLIHIEKQTPETQPLRIPLNNDSVSEKPRDQQANTASKSSLNSNSNPNPVQLHQNSPKPDSRNINNTKEATSPRSNIQIRNIKKTNPVPKPVQNARERNVVEPKIQMNNSIEKVIESADKGRKNVAEPKIQQNNAGERVAETSDKIRKNMLEAKNQQNNSVERVNESPDKARKNIVEPRPQQNYSVEKVVGISDKARKSPEKPNYQSNYANHAIRSQNHVRHGLELYDRIKTEGEVPDDSMDREINALNMQLGSEPKTERVGTANAIYSRGNIAKQGLINQESQQRLNTVGSPRSNRNQDTKGALSPVFSPKAEFNGGAMSKGVKDDFTKQSKYYVGRQSPDWAGHSGDKGNFKGVIQSVLDIRDDYWTQADYSPKGDLKQHFNMYSKEKEGKRSALVGFGKGINSSKKIKRKSLEGLDEYKGLSSFRDRVAQQGKYNFSPVNGYAVDEVSERLRSEPSSSIHKGFNPKIKAYDLYPESPRSGNGQNPQSAYYFERDPSAEARFQRHSPQPKLFKVKLTIEECIRQEVLRDTKEPAATKEEAQMRIMYRAMLTRAKQQPKVSAWMKKCIQEADLGPLNEDHPVVEYSVFEQYVTDFIQAHLPCGENCSHLRDFYAKIGYLTSWNNREVMSVKRAQIGGTAMESLLPSPKFPGLKKKKKEIEML